MATNNWFEIWLKLNSMSNLLWVSRIISRDKTYRNHLVSAKSTAERRTEHKAYETKSEDVRVEVRRNLKWFLKNYKLQTSFWNTKGRIFLKLLGCLHQSVWSDSHMQIVNKLFGKTLYLYVDSMFDGFCIWLI